MTEPAKHVIRVTKGGSKILSGTLAIAQVPWNLTGYTAKLQVRENAYATSALVTLTHTDGIVLGGSAGTIVITFSPTITVELTPKIYKYDLKVTSGDGSEANYLLQGDFIVVEGISQ
jgi:hypothetical protein